MSLNVVALVGNLTRDPETRVVGANQTAVTKFGLAVNDRRGENETTLFVDVECWGKTAETVGAYLTKGRQVAIQGKLKMDNWEDKNTGDKRSKLYVVAEQVSFIGKAEKSEEAPAKPTKGKVTSPPDDEVPF
jgi:single-strand DNA-binding protein